MSRSIRIDFLALALIAIAASVANSQDSKQENSGKDTPDPSKNPPAASEMADAMAAIMPGKVHERLAKLQGKWKVTSTVTVAGTEPQTSDGNAELKMILGGRFVQETGDGSLMGFPVEHVRVWGFNNGTNKFQAIWLYTMSTGFLFLDGTPSDDGKSIQWMGHFDNEAGIREELTAVTTFADDDHFEVVLSAGKMPDGSTGPTMKAAYSRVK